ncbi:MAG: hypothetical protein IPP76_13830 [Moraxellaceae bacterium]|nr:hypothetical protein [Moraxellaceae bacterium]
MIEYIEFDFAVTQANQRPLLRQNPSHSQGGVWGLTWGDLLGFFMPQMITKSRRNVLKIRRFTPVFYRFFIDFLLVLLYFLMSFLL